MRLIHAVRDLSAETGVPVETVALYTDADRAATFVREADLAYPLGPASARPYLDHALLERALVETGADAAWVGWGFVAEDPAFAELCEQARRHLHRPERRGDAQAGRQDRRQADRRGGRRPGRAVEPRRGRHPGRRPGGGRDDRLPADAQGHRGRRRARHPRSSPRPADLTEAFERTSAEALRAFGSGTVFLERLVTGARHVEVQVIADGQGTAWALGVRDCSVQRRNQKIIEESASPVLAPGAGRGAEGVGRAAGPRRRLPGRRDRRVPLPPGRAGGSPSSRSTPGCRSSTRSPS